MAKKMYDTKILNEIRKEKTNTKIQNKEAQPQLREYMKQQAMKRANGFYAKK